MKKLILLLLLILNSLFLIHNSHSPVYAQTPADWWTVAANPQRTSWVPQEVTGNNLIWYRPVEAFIPMNSQLITYQDKVYVATARGLYVMKAADGAFVCRFDTELPLGNSPSVFENVAYVGGFDRKIHALDAGTCVEKWSFGGASAGYSTNPLIIKDSSTGNSTVVIAGNRDGGIYAIGGEGHPQKGQQLWKFQAGGAVIQSPAYKNGVVYFAANDNYGYAIKINPSSQNGEQVWRTASKMAGDGFESYWPVIYRDDGGTDYVAFVGAYGYRDKLDPGMITLGATGDESLFQIEQQNIGSVPSGIYTYHNNKPYRRVFFMYNAATGAEFKDSKGYPPFTMVGTHAGNRYPAVVSGDNYLTATNLKGAGGQFPLDSVYKWKPNGSLSEVGFGGNVDEPQALSAGGSLIYRSLCCDRAAGSTGNNSLYDFGKPLYTFVPNYNIMWYGYDWGDHEGLVGKYGYTGRTPLLHDVTPGVPTPTAPVLGKNGVYHSHGQQNPIIPYSYNGKTMLLIHRGNSVMAWGSSTPLPNPQLGIIRVNPKNETPVVPSDVQLKERLKTEVQKIIDAGLLAPGYYVGGQIAASNLHQSMMATYFDNPGDTLWTLSMAYPYLPNDIKDDVKNYLVTIWQEYFASTMYARTGWLNNQGAPLASRQAAVIPGDLAAAMTSNASAYKKSTAIIQSTEAGSDSPRPWSYPPQNFYAMWKYAQVLNDGAVVNPANSPTVSQVYSQAKGKMSSLLSEYMQMEGNYFGYYYQVNAWIDGFTGFLNLSQLAGNPSGDASLRTQVQSKLTEWQQNRSTNFTKNYSSVGNYHTYMFNISRNWIYMTKELGSYLRQNALAKVTDAVDEYNQLGSYWFVSRYDAAIDEGAQEPLYDVTMFLAKAYILNQPREELYKYLDVPAFEQGDLLYINNLIALIEAPTSNTATPSPTSGPITPTPIPGDINKDTKVNTTDLLLILGKYGLSGITGGEDINTDNKVNILDAGFVIKNWIP